MLVPTTLRSVAVDATLSPDTQESELGPILVLPGLLGSIINAKSGTEPPPSACNGHLTSEYMRLWARVSELTFLNCFKILMELRLISGTNSTTPPYVHTHIPEDGIFATSYLDPSNLVTRYASAYMANLYNYLTHHGYTLYKNLDAIAYDWRRSPFDFRQEGEYFDRIKQRVESLYIHNGNRTVTLVGHSMGGATGALFLSSHVDAAWKSTYIRQFISVVGVYGGAVKALASTMAGTTDFLSSSMTGVMRTFPGVHSLIPPPSDALPGVWDDFVLFRIGTKNYTTNDVSELYQDVGLTEYMHSVDVLRSVGYYAPPGVPVHCLYTESVPTVQSVTAMSTSEYDLKRSTFGLGPGDGTVPLRSLEVCSSWSTKQTQPVKTQMFHSDHGKMIKKDVNVWEYIFSYVNEYDMLSYQAASLHNPPIDSEEFFLNHPDIFDVFRDSWNHTLSEGSFY